MNERVHRALDGELPREDLTPAERNTAASIDSATDALRASLTGRVPAGLDMAVMKRIRELGLEPLPARDEPVLRRAVRSVWTPREIRIRPAYGLAAAALLALAIWLPFRAAPPITTTDSTAPQSVFVQFRLDAGAASNVALAGSFSDWQPSHALRETAPGIWTALVSVEPGVHDYVFVVDGREFVPDPVAPQVADGFGGVNSRLTVLPPAPGL